MRNVIRTARVRSEDTCILHNTDRGKEIQAHVVEFRYQEKLICSLPQGIEIRLSFNRKHNEYVGSMAGLEFTSPGPKTVGY